MLGSQAPFIREGLGTKNLLGEITTKAGPVKTDQDNYIVDAPFSQLLLSQDVAAEKASGTRGEWEVEALARAIKDIHGVLDVGIFSGPTGPEAAAHNVAGGQRPVACYFGMEDGSVTVKTAPKKDMEGWVPFFD